MKKQDSYKPVILAGLWLLFLAAGLLFSAYDEFKDDGIALTELGWVLAIIGLIAVFGSALLAASYSRPFRRKYFTNWEDDAPVIECKQCLYDLRGSVLAGGTQCPECGSTVPPEQIEQIKRLDQGIKANR